MTPVVRSGLHSTVAVLSLAVGVAISLAHPLGQGLMPLLFALAVILVWFRPRGWPLLLLGGLPLAGLAPWTGWLLLDEADLLILATAAGGHARLWRDVQRKTGAVTPLAEDGPCVPARMVVAAAVLWVLTQLAGLMIAWPSAGASWSLSGTYLDPSTGLRLIKPLVGLVLLWPLWRLTDARQVVQGFLLCGAVLAAWVLWERVTFAGLLDFRLHYRVTGPFWETHVGGAALDLFLIVCWPMTLARFGWALQRSHPAGQALHGLLVVMLLYAMVVTYSRITYGAAVITAALCWGLHRVAARGHGVARRRGPSLLVWAFGGLLMLMLGQAVLQPKGLMTARFDTLARDVQIRIEHWGAALALQDSTWETLVGIGPGRFASAWRDRPQAQQTLRPGGHAVIEHEGRSALRIEAAQGARYWGQQHRVVQRLAAPGPSDAVLHFSARLAAPQGPTTLVLELCEKQLLYARRCAPRYLPVVPGDLQSWVEVHLPLVVRPRNLIDPGAHPQYLRPLSLSLLNRDARHVVLVADISLKTPSGVELVANGDFRRGMQRWFFSSDMGHLPWSTHNLLVHVLVENGVLGALALAVMLVAAFRAGWWRLRRITPGMQDALVLWPALVAGLAGALMVGLVDSLIHQVRPGHLLMMMVAACVVPALGRSGMENRCADDSGGGAGVCGLALGGGLRSTSQDDRL